MSQCVLHAVCIQVEVSQGLVSGDGAYLLQTASEVFGQRPHGYTFDLSVHDDGASSQTLRRNTHRQAKLSEQHRSSLFDIIVD